jgi:hypothetical protein
MKRTLRSAQGQATVEWVGLVLLAALALGALVAVAPRVDGRAFGGLLAHRIVCAVEGGCDDGDAGLRAAYGERDAELVRRYTPNLVYEPGERQLPVDYRACRTRRCADTVDDPDADLHRSLAGRRASVFTHVVRRGGRLYIQYWLYYPDSNTAWAGADRLWERSRLLPLIRKVVRGTSDYPGFHRDDWEGVQLRIDADGTVWARASSHGHYQGCKQRACRNRWIHSTGWSRVSRGSHAGHIPVERGGPLYPGPGLRERTSTGDGLRLIPLESVDRLRYRPLDAEIRPPWRKPVYGDPESDAS